MTSRLTFVLAGTLTILAGRLQAQTPVVASAGSPGPSGRGYIEGVAQSAFGNQTSQSYGAELGFTWRPNLQIFGEGGFVRNAAPASQAAAAQLIATALSSTQPSSVTFTAKEPVEFVIAGVKYLIPVESRVVPYVMGGAGAARVTQDVHFIIGGSDVTSNLVQFGAVLGSDLAGSVTKPMIGFGAGVQVPVWQRVILDLQYRYGRVVDGDASINVSRAGIGIGLSF
jgi:opacity protein-like surface antigen